jgi:transmembrane sensor
VEKPTKIQRIAALLNGLHQRKISVREQAELDEWFHSLKVKPSEFKNWMAEAGGEEVLSEKMLLRFNRKIARERKTKRYFYYGLAASLTIMLSVGFLLFRPTDKQAIRQQPVLAKNTPGGNRAILTMDNGEEVDLNEKPVGYISRQAGSNIYKSSAGKLSYAQNTIPAGGKAKYNTLSTPRAGQYQVELPDGTRVWLNAESRLRYPTSFSDQERKVELTGEAYFEVAHNRKMPFKVLTANQEITVLGTHFNIKGYHDESSISTTLLQGSVSVMNQLSGKTNLLIPGKQSTILKTNGNIEVRSIAVDQVMAWKNGYFIFENQDIRTIMKLISRWYDVDVSYQHTGDVRLGGTFSKSSDLPALLKSFELISDLRFDIRGRRVTVRD